MMKDEEELTARFVEEFTKLGITKSKVSIQTGFTPQTLTNITKGYNLPSVMLLAKIRAEYPGFDTQYIITGVRSSDDSEEMQRLKYELKIKEATITRLVMPGKSFNQGAIKSPDRAKEIRKITGKQATNSARRKPSFYQSARVQGAMH